MRNMAANRAHRPVFEAASWFCLCGNQRSGCQGDDDRQCKLLVPHDAVHPFVRSHPDPDGVHRCPKAIKAQPGWYEKYLIRRPLLLR